MLECSCRCVAPRSSRGCCKALLDSHSNDLVLGTEEGSVLCWLQALYAHMQQLDEIVSHHKLGLPTECCNPCADVHSAQHALSRQTCML